MIVFLCLFCAAFCWVDIKCVNYIVEGGRVHQGRRVHFRNNVTIVMCIDTCTLHLIALSSYFKIPSNVDWIIE